MFINDKKIIVLEGLPASGKTTLVNMLSQYDFQKINESLGKIRYPILNQEDIFQEILERYALAKEATSKYVILDRGYISMLARDYCIGKRNNNFNQLIVKQKRVKDAFLKGKIYQPDLYVYLVASPELSFKRRPRRKNNDDVRSTRKGMLDCAEYYDMCFGKISNTIPTLILSADMETQQIVNYIFKILN